MTRLTAIVGNPRPGSRTRQVALEVLGQVAALFRQKGLSIDERVIDLSEYRGVLFEDDNQSVQELVKVACDSDLVVVVSPTYKAAYTGLVKSFLDLFPPNGLGGRTAIPVMIGAAPVHLLAVEVHLRPVLIELGASCPTKGLFVLESAVPDLQNVVSKWLEEAGAVLTRGVTDG